MKKTIAIGLSLAVLASFNVAFAEEGQTDEVTESKWEQLKEQRETKKTEWQKKQDELKAEREAKKAEWQKKQDEVKTQREEMLKQKRQERCSKIQERIAERVSNFDKLENKHMAVYTNMQNRIQKFIDRLGADGLDTSKVTADLSVLQTKIQKFSDDYKIYLTLLGDAKSFKCGETDVTATTDVKSKMQAARAALVVVHKDAQDIRNFVRTVVRPDIMELRKQKVEAKKDEVKAEKNKTTEVEIEVENETTTQPEAQQ